jgi:hypothetical protein
MRQWCTMGLGSFGKIILIMPLLSQVACLVVPENSPNKKLSESKKLADEWISIAQHSSLNTLTPADLLADMREALATRPIELISKTNLGPCDNTNFEGFVLAYIVSPISVNPINMCPKTMEYSTRTIAQVLVHEVVHASNIANECFTTGHELNIMTLAGQRPFKNGYVDSCPGVGDEVNFALEADGNLRPLSIHWDRSIPKGARY